MEQFLASAIVNGNEIRLVEKQDRYFIYWGEVDKPKAVKELLTLKGKKPSPVSAHKQFLEAIEATKHLKFSRL
jgi:uracil DNA glycosylase